ncbi:M23 family metallopeptidase [Polyangium sp. y55x31]|uniref:M23 family metallopeptidase n=1 Tax=Polyangium sp. y55x31 TaxID=3042688 RepID=UPI0024821CC5|nr:M23 family metallopeptidase [Polyangium sp. y55x31]MDI1479386.1 M23 family metallopeptidase [Polyangium sp. y55x31]
MHRRRYLLLLAGLVACSGARAPEPSCPPTMPAPLATPSAAPTPNAPAAAAPPVTQARIPGGTITVAVAPTRAYVERTDGAQLLNCDLRIKNGTGVAWKLVEIEVSVHDSRDALAWRRLVTDGGVSPAISTVPNRELPEGAELLLLNPVSELALDLELARVHFTLTFVATNGDERLVVGADVRPIQYEDHAELRFPLAGRLIVWSGHDYLAHHRRWDYVFTPIRSFGFVSNAGRYAYDLVPVDATGAMHAGHPEDNKSWFGFGAPVLAPAVGKVVAVRDDHPDNREFDVDKLADDLMLMYGNHVVIDHGHGEHSLFAHLQQKSVTVKVGDVVKAGDRVGAIGASGSANFPHLHYQLQDGPNARAEGLPSYFHDFVRHRGARAIPVKRGTIGSGDLIEASTAKRR